MKPTLEKIQRELIIFRAHNSDGNGHFDTIIAALEQAEKIAKGEWYIAVNIGEPNPKVED